ncbi:MAG: glycosyltransferase family protein [Pirellulales bacterium]
MKVFYGICGEGLGHSGRAIALIERLTALGHRVIIFTFADAYQLMARSGYDAQRIAGLQFAVSADGSVNLLGTVRKFSRYLQSRRQSLDMIRQMALAERPDLFITDFEPLTSLAAASLRIPCISVDSQHRFCHPLRCELPLHLRAYARLAGEFVGRWIKAPQLSIVAVFHDCSASRHYRRVEALQRDRIARLRPCDGDHVVLYGRGEIGRRMAQIASSVPERFIAYGFNGMTAPNIEYMQASYEQFAADLASCKAVVSTAGQQLIGEARYFGKPLLAVPIRKQYEQEINARLVRTEGIGDFCPIDRLSAERIQQFLQRRFARSRPANGLDQALELMRIGYG